MTYSSENVTVYINGVELKGGFSEGTIHPINPEHKWFMDYTVPVEVLNFTKVEWEEFLKVVEESQTATGKDLDVLAEIPVKKYLCPHGDCGWCYYDGNGNPNDQCGQCNNPQECEVNINGG